MKKITFISILLLCSVTLWGKGPKYVFYFIGDGMGVNHVELGGGDSLNFTQFPYKGTLTTHSANKKITDSAAAGTALSTGTKTSNGTLGLSADHKTKLKSIAYTAKETGRKVGIVSSVSIDHATPAAFYANAESRNMSYEIASQLPLSGFDLFAGAGFVKPKELFQTLIDSMYTIVRGKNVVLDGSKIVWIQTIGKDVGELPYAATKRQEDDLTLPIFTEKAIEFLAADSSKGFFMMVEGGKIDWAAHANSAKNVRGEVQDFAQAIAHAIKFYEAHPEQTLIIVTADHETGGLSLNPTRWSSMDHTAANVPIYSIGVGADNFGKNLDNTDVAKIIRSLF